LFAVVDQFAEDADDAADAGGHVRGGPRWIGVGGWGGGLGGGRHERNRNTKPGTLSRKTFLNNGRGARGRRNADPVRGTGDDMPGGRYGLHQLAGARQAMRAMTARSWVGEVLPTVAWRGRMGSHGAQELLADLRSDAVEWVGLCPRWRTRLGIGVLTVFGKH
jgi:hypothetical protein